MRFSIKSIAIVCVVISMYGCASIPASTADLSRQVIAEAHSMHQLNIALVNKLFDERKDKVNEFINNQYIPTFVKNFQSKIPPGVDVNKELPNILKSIMPVISQKRDSLHNILDEQRDEMVTALNDNYATYQQASASLQNLISSAVKLKQTEKNTLAQIQKLVNTNIDVGAIQKHLDKLLMETGNGFDKLLDIKATINPNN
jgi:hypothetical protein